MFLDTFNAITNIKLESYNITKRISSAVQLHISPQFLCGLDPHQQVSKPSYTSEIIMMEICSLYIIRANVNPTDPNSAEGINAKFPLSGRSCPGK